MQASRSVTEFDFCDCRPAACHLHFSSELRWPPPLAHSTSTRHGSSTPSAQLPSSTDVGKGQQPATLQQGQALHLKPCVQGDAICAIHFHEHRVTAVKGKPLVVS